MRFLNTGVGNMPRRGSFDVVRTLDELRTAYQALGPDVALSLSFTRPPERCGHVHTLEDAEETFAYLLEDESNAAGEVGIAKVLPKIIPKI